MSKIEEAVENHFTEDADEVQVLDREALLAKLQQGYKLSYDMRRGRGAFMVMDPSSKPMSVAKEILDALLANGTIVPIGNQVIGKNKMINYKLSESVGGSTKPEVFWNKNKQRSGVEPEKSKRFLDRVHKLFPNARKIEGSIDKLGRAYLSVYYPFDADDPSGKKSEKTAAAKKVASISLDVNGFTVPGKVNTWFRNTEKREFSVGFGWSLPIGRRPGESVDLQDRIETDGGILAKWLV